MKKKIIIIGIILTLGIANLCLADSVTVSYCPCSTNSGGSVPKAKPIPPVSTCLPGDVWDPETGGTCIGWITPPKSVPETTRQVVMAVSVPESVPAETDDNSQNITDLQSQIDNLKEDFALSVIVSGVLISILIGVSIS